MNVPHLIYIKEDGVCFWGGYNPATENEDLLTCLSSVWDPNAMIEKGYAESIFQPFTFISNPYLTYEVCIDAKNLDCGVIDDPSHLRIRAINDIVVQWPFNYEFVPPVLPGSDFEYIGDDVVNSFNFQTYSYTFQPNSDYNNLEIINALGTPGVTFLAVDNVNVNCENSGLTGVNAEIMDKIAQFSAVYEANDVDITEYNWTFGDGGTSTNPSPSHMYGEYDTYEVCLEFVDEYGCCGMACEMIEIVPPPISCPVDENTLYIDATNPMTNSFSDLVDMGLFISGGTLSNTDIVIKGAFTLDENFTFEFCNFYFEPGAELIVESPGKIEIKSNSTLQGCSKMWKGITVNGTQPENTFWFRGNRIKDAYAAIEIKDGANVLQNSNVFIDNFIGVYAQWTPNMKQHFGSPILLSIFITEGNMLDPYDDQPAWSDVPYAGVHVSKLDHLVVRSIAIWGFVLHNYFTGIQNGIIVNATNLEANGNVFSNLVGENPLNAIEGRCISGTNMMSVQAKSNFCTDTGGGFRITNSPNSQIEISNNTIKRFSNTYDVKFGIYLEKNDNSEIEIINNDISVGSNSRFGIRFINGNGLKKMDISYNFIHHGIDWLSALSLSTINFVNGVNGKFTHNNIEKEAQAFPNTGVSLFMVNNVSFENNNISDCFGFSLSNSNNNHFRDNEIFGGSGFSQANSINNLFCCNILTNSWGGFTFRGASDMLNLSSNTLDNCTFGLDLKNQIPPQDNKGNKWIGESKTARIVPPSGSTAEDIALASKFKVNSVQSNNSTMRPEIFIPDQSLEDFWFEENEFPNASCGSSPTCGVTPLEPGVVEHVPTGSDACDGFREYIEALVGPKVASDFQHQNEWTLFYYVFKHFDDLPLELWEDCIDIHEFMNSNPKIATYVKAGKSFENAFIPTSTQSENLLTHQANISTALKEIQVLYDNAPEDYETYDPDIEQYQNVISNSSNVITGITNSLNVLGEVNLNEALNDVLSLQTDYDFEEKLKTVWTAKIKVALYGNTGITTNEWQEIEVIANGCPDADGLALYEARSLMVTKEGAQIIFGESGLCDGGDNRNSTNIEENKLSIYPNPTSGMLKIRGLDGYKGTIDLRLYTIEGVLKFEKTLLNLQEDVNLELTNINSGIYILEIKQDEVNLLSQKIVVTK